MQNLSDSDFVKARPHLRRRMKRDEQIIRDLIKARDNGTLVETGDVDDFLSTASKHETELQLIRGFQDSHTLKTGGSYKPTPSSVQTTCK